MIGKTIGDGECGLEIGVAHKALGGVTAKTICEFLAAVSTLFAEVITILIEFATLLVLIRFATNAQK